MEVVEYIAGTLLIVVLPVSLLILTASAAVRSYNRDEDSQD